MASYVLPIFLFVAVLTIVFATPPADEKPIAPPGCGGDPNAVWSDCPSACEPTCTKPDPQVCTDQCLKPRCVCKQGLVLNELTEKCVEREECPVLEWEDPNAVYKGYTSACEPTCSTPDFKLSTVQVTPSY